MTRPSAVSAGTIRGLLGLLLAAAVAAGVLGINDSPLLPATHADGVRYLSAAASLAEGGELADPVARWSSPEESRFLAHFPPGYPLTLTGLIRMGLRPHVAALWLTVASAAATAFLLFLLTSLVAGWWVGVLAVVLFFAAPPVVLLHSAVWSEPLYLPLVLGLVGTMALWPRRSGVHGALAAAGVLVRYAGVAGVAAAGIWAWHCAGRDRGGGEGEPAGAEGREGGLAGAEDGEDPVVPGGVSRRAWAVTLAVAPGLAVLGVWHLMASAHREAVRSPGLYVDGLGSNVMGLLYAVAGWLAPLPAGPAELRRSAALVVGAVVVLLWVRAFPGVRGTGGRADTGSGAATASDVPEARAAPPARARLWIACGLFAVCYAVTVVLARLFADHAIPFDARIFMPVFLVGTAVTAVAIQTLLARRDTASPTPDGQASRSSRARSMGIAGVGLAVLWLAGAVWTNAVGIPLLKERGRFYTSWVWFSSDVVEWVEGPSRQWPRLYSNEPWLLLFQTGRTPRLLPTRRDVGDWSAFEAAYRERPGPIVVLYPLRPDDLPPEELQARLGLRPELVQDEGIVLVPAVDEPPDPGSSVRGARSSEVAPPWALPAGPTSFSPAPASWVPARATSVEPAEAFRGL